MNEAQRQQEIEEVKKFESLCYAVLNNSQGKELLKYLSVKFLNAPVAEPTKNTNFAYFREGQNDLIRKLRAGILFHVNRLRGNSDE